MVKRRPAQLHLSAGYVCYQLSPRPAPACLGTRLALWKWGSVLPGSCLALTPAILEDSLVPGLLFTQAPTARGASTSAGQRLDATPCTCRPRWTDATGTLPLQQEGERSPRPAPPGPSPGRGGNSREAYAQGRATSPAYSWA